MFSLYSSLHGVAPVTPTCMGLPPDPVTPTCMVLPPDPRDPRDPYLHGVAP